MFFNYSILLLLLPYIAFQLLNRKMATMPKQMASFPVHLKRSSFKPKASGVGNCGHLIKVNPSRALLFPLFVLHYLCHGWDPADLLN